MRPVTNFTLHAILAAALAALAASSAAAEPAVSGEVFVRLPSGAHGKGEHIEIQSYQWGSSQAGRVSGVKPADPGQNGEWSADVEKPSEGAASGDVTLKGSKIGQNSTRVRRSDITMKRSTSQTRPVGGVRVASGDVDGSGSGASETLTVGGSQTESQATGKRQHKPFVMQNYYDETLDEPLPSGSVRVKVKMPWLACKVGTRYPTIELGSGARIYRLTDALVTSCGTSANQPTENISFSYAKLDY